MMRERISMEIKEMCELRKASDRERKARKRASACDDEASIERLIDQKRKAVVKHLRLSMRLSNVELAVGNAKLM